MKCGANSLSAIENWDEYYDGSAFPPWEGGEVEKVLLSLMGTGVIAKKEITLDLGCGMATDMIYLIEKGYEVTGLDISMNGLLMAKQRAAKGNMKLNLCQGNALYLPFKDKCIGFINDRGCFHHIKEHLRERYRQEIYRVIKPGGKVLLRFFGEAYYNSGGSGQILLKKDVLSLFENYFHVGTIYDYKGIGNKWSVDMSWCLMSRD